MRKVAIGLVFIAILSATASIQVLAAEEETCRLDQAKFNELKTVQSNPLLDPFARIKAELKIRRELLTNTIDCATEEARELQSSFNDVETNNLAVKALQTQFSPWFTDTIAYYKLQKAKIGDLGLKGSRDFARNLKVWRDGNYKPTAKIVSNFIIWAQNQDLIEIAQNRINQIGRTIDFLGLAGNTEIQKLWREVGEEFKDALEFNEGAKESLRVYSSPDDSSEAIKSSLKSLAATYQKLFDVIDAINQTLAL